jgi:hypothetical protein
LRARFYDVRALKADRELQAAIAADKEVRAERADDDALVGTPLDSQPFSGTQQWRSTAASHRASQQASQWASQAGSQAPSSGVGDAMELLMEMHPDSEDEDNVFDAGAEDGTGEMHPADCECEVCDERNKKLLEDDGDFWESSQLIESQLSQGSNSSLSTSQREDSSVQFHPSQSQPSQKQPMHTSQSQIASQMPSYGARFSAEIYTRGCHWFPRLFA